MSPKWKKPFYAVLAFAALAAAALMLAPDPVAVEVVKLPPARAGNRR
jgi:hypothetical protein